MKKTEESNSLIEGDYIRVPMTIVVVLERHILYPILGIEKTLELSRVWNQEIQEVIDLVTDKNPFVYCLDECLTKVYNLKHRLEELNTPLLIPMPILYIGVVRAECDPLSHHLKTVFSHCSGRSIGLYFSPSVTERMKLLNYKQEQTKVTLVNFNGLGCSLQKRDYSISANKDTRVVIVKDPILCYMLFSSFEQQSSFIRNLEILRDKPFVCSCVGNDLQLITVWNKLDFRLVVDSEASCLISRSAEFVIQKTKGEKYSAQDVELFNIIILLREHPNAVIVHPLAVSYCRDIEKFDDHYHHYNCYRFYKKDLPELTPCDCTSLLKRIEQVERVVECRDECKRK